MAWEVQDNSNMSITGHSYAEEEASDSRQRLRPWLISRLNTGTIPGLQWVDRSAQIFKVPWKHGGKQDWVPEQSQIFKDWACHTGKFREGVDTPTYAKWKTNLRCALNKAPDIQEIPEMTRKSDPNPYKVYRFLKRQKPKKIPPPVASTPDPEPVPPGLGSDAPVPTFLNEYTSPGVVLEYNGGPTFGQSSQNQLSAGVDHEGKHFYQGANSDNWNIKQPHGYRDTGIEDMEFENITPASAAGPLFIPAQSSGCHTGTAGKYSTVPQSAELDSGYLPHMPKLGTSTFNPMAYNTLQLNPIRPNEGHPHLPFDESVTSHDCISVTGTEMYLEIIYRNNIINSQHIKTQARGCRITYTMVPRNIEEEIPDVIKDALFGPDSRDRELVELPQWPSGLCPDNLLPSVNDLLKNMHRGIILECHCGNIYATRLCKTSLYYSSEFTPTTLKLLRHDDSIEKTKIFDMDNDFKPALERYASRKGAKRPSPYVYLYIGQKGAQSELSTLLIVVRLTSCQALTLLNGVDQRRCQDHSMHISTSTELDQLGECVRKQLNGELHI